MAEAPWKHRVTQVLQRLPAGSAIEAEMLAVHVKPPSFREFSEEVVRRAIEGRLSLVFRVFSPETRIVLKDVPLGEAIPTEIEDDTTGETVRIEPERDVEMIIGGTSSVRR